MNYEIAETLKLIIDQYDGRTQGSLFIKMNELPGYHSGGAHLTELQDMGYISKPRQFDNGADITCILRSVTVGSAEANGRGAERAVAFLAA